MKIEGHYDQQADIAWLRFEGYDPATVVAEEAEFGLRELDPAERRIVGLEYSASEQEPPGKVARDAAGAAARRRDLIAPFAASRTFIRQQPLEEFSLPGRSSWRLKRRRMDRTDNHLLRPAEVVQLLGVSRSWLYEASKSGRIPCVRLGGADGPVRLRRECSRSG